MVSYRPVIENGITFKKSERKLYNATIAFIIIITMFVGGICVWYYSKLQTTIRDESNEYLQEIAVQIEKNINRIISDTYSMLYSTDIMLGDTADISFAKLSSVSQYQQKYWKYQRIFLIDQNGNAFDEFGNSIFISGGTFLQDAVLNSKESMSPLQVVDGTECSVFAIPINRTVGGIEVSAMAVTYDSEEFSNVLSMSAFNNRAYSNIVSVDGTIILSSGSDINADFGYNVLSSIDSSKSVPKKDMQQLRDNIRNMKIGTVEFEFNNRREYMVYHPIGLTDWMLFTFVPIEVVNEKSNILLAVTLIISACIVVSFSLFVFIIVSAFKRYQARLEQIAYIDDITGGNTIDRFYEMASYALSAYGRPTYALVYTNFNKFKILNENFGRIVCDQILRKFDEIISDDLIDNECMGRLSADNFCILIKYDSVENIRDRFQKWYNTANNYIDQAGVAWTWPMVELGIYVVDDETLPFPQMIDRAKLALREKPRSINSKLRYAVYNDEVRSGLIREKHLEDMMESSLLNNEFKMFLQPKYCVDGEFIVGAEALSRWVSSTEGMIYPNEFIPLFEKNGFIAQLDLWMFEEVCKVLRKWIDLGHEPIKISVNCSRILLRDTEFLTQYRSLSEKYNVPTQLIEIELTESIVLEDSEHFKYVVDEIHNAGFGCSMDDFGSGYSSLNMLHEISVDTLKLDKVFFLSTAGDTDRTESVVRSIISMAKALNMETVAEGVEHREQISMLRRIGCEVIQGFVYSKPIPLEDFEKLWTSEKKGVDKI